MAISTRRINTISAPQSKANKSSIFIHTKNQRHLLVEHNCSNTSPLLIHSICRQAFTQLLRTQNTVSIHGAGFQSNNKATLLIAPPEMGKTSLLITICKQTGFPVISDDLLFIEEHSNTTFSIGNQPYLQLRPKTMVDQKLPLDSNLEHYISEHKKYLIEPQALGLQSCHNDLSIGNIYFINNADQAEITAINSSEALQLLLSSLYKMSDNNQLNQQTMGLLAKAINQSANKRLTYPLNDTGINKAAQLITHDQQLSDISSQHK